MSTDIYGAEPIMTTERAIQAAIVRVDMFIERALPAVRILLGTTLLICGVFAMYAFIRQIKRKRSRHRKRKRRKKNANYRVEGSVNKRDQNDRL